MIDNAMALLSIIFFGMGTVYLFLGERDVFVVLALCAIYLRTQVDP